MPGRVFITQPIPEPGPSLLRQGAETITVNPDDRVLSQDELCGATAGCEAVVRVLIDAIDRGVLATVKAQGVRLSANIVSGFDSIDLEAATGLGILVTNTPGVLTEATTAGLTLALLPALARCVVEGDQEMCSGRYQGWGPAYLLGGDAKGQTIGLLGPGRVAAAVAERARGFRMRLLYHGRQASPTLEALGARPVGLSELLAESDFVSLYVPLTAEAIHLIPVRAAARMKPSAYLINTAWGPVVDEAALVEAIQARRIARAGLDVYENEPAMSAGLADCPNTVLLPHLGSASIATRAAMSRMAAENVLALLQDRRPPNLVNPGVWSGTDPGSNAGGGATSVSLPA